MHNGISYDLLSNILPDTPLLDSALIYAEAGFFVLPLDVRGKGPFTRFATAGVHSATQDPETIKKWWHSVPDANIGITAPPGYYILDVDPRNGGSSEGFPDTLAAFSGGGGTHHFYKGAAPREDRDSGVNVQTSQKKYVVAAPSIHPSGGQYSWGAVQAVSDWGGGVVKEPESKEWSGGANLEAVEEFLPRIEIDSLNYGKWVDIGRALWALGAEFEVFRDWSAGSILHLNTEGDCKWRWRSYTSCRFDPEAKLRRHAGGTNNIDEFDEIPVSEVLTEEELKEFEKEGRELTSIRAPQLPESAMPGLIGEFVRLGCENSEATPSMVAATVLSQFAARYCHAMTLEIGDVDRPVTPFMLAVGPTGKGRKGSSEALPKRVFAEADKLMELPPLHSVTGLSSGEGLIQLLSEDDDGQDDEFPTITDKRLLVSLSEFSRILAAASREGNTITEIIRDAYDGVPLQTNTKNSSISAEAYHLGIMGHITFAEFLNRTKGVDLENGFLNRFLVFSSFRTKLVPIPQRVPMEEVNRLAQKVVDNVGWLYPDGLDCFERGKIRVIMDRDAKVLWIKRYAKLTSHHGSNEAVNGMLGRVEAQVLNYAAIIAAINGSRRIDMESLLASYAWVQHAVETVEFIFSDIKARAKGGATKRRSDWVEQWLAEQGGTATMAALGMDTRRGKNKMNVEQRKAAVARLVGGHPPRVVMTVDKSGKGRPKTTLSLTAGVKPAF